MRSLLWTAALAMLPAAAAAQAFGDPERAKSSNSTIEQTERREAADKRSDTAEPSVMFAAVDADGDGVITKVELRKAIKSLGTLDTNHDGKITLDEGAAGGSPNVPWTNLAQLMESILANDNDGDRMLSLDEVPVLIMPLLLYADENEDRKINRQELTAACTHAQKQSSLLQTMAKMPQYDSNNDGIITYTEVPRQDWAMIRGADLNTDGAIDTGEMQSIVSTNGSHAVGGQNAAGRFDDQPIIFQPNGAIPRGRTISPVTPGRASGGPIQVGPTAAGASAPQRAPYKPAAASRVVAPPAQ